MSGFDEVADGASDEGIEAVAETGVDDRVCGLLAGSVKDTCNDEVAKVPSVSSCMGS